MGDLNYYKISCYEPYEGSDDIIVAHENRFTDSELSVMIYDVIDNYVRNYADEDLYYKIMPCDVRTSNLFEGGLLVHLLHSKYGFVKCPIVSEASVESGYLLRDDYLQSPFLHGRYKDLEIGQCKECKKEGSLMFNHYGCPVKNPRNKMEEEND